ncbi:hypothetical protein D3C83_215520 [compost metagenome]
MASLPPVFAVPSNVVGGPAMRNCEPRAPSMSVGSPRMERVTFWLFVACQVSLPA